MGFKPKTDIRRVPKHHQKYRRARRRILFKKEFAVARVEDLMRNLS